MSKVNKVIISIMMIFIVLMLSSVFASSIENVTSVLGNGTIDNPYLIDMSAGSSVTIKTEKVPFYFQIVNGHADVNGGVYNINYNVSEGTVKFLLTDLVSLEAGTTNMHVVVNESEYNDKEFQLGIGARKSDGIVSNTPTYIIQEVLRYYAPPADNTYIEGASSDYDDFNRNVVTRYLNLSNVEVNIGTGVGATKGDMFFFAQSPTNDEQVKRLFEAINYKYIGTDSNLMSFSNEISLGGSLHLYDIKVQSFNTQKIYSTTDEETSDDIINPFSIVYKFDGKTNTALIDDDDGSDGSSSIESIITRILVNHLGDGLLLNMLQKVLGRDLTVNSLIFNTYDKTKIDFFSKHPNKISSVLIEVVNNWYGIFLKLAYIFYVIILVYIGIMIILKSGTKDQDKAKSFLGNWFVGLALLLIIPRFGIPYIIKANDAFVKYMNGGKEELKSYYNVYNPDLEGDILGGDSSTLSIEELVSKREDIQSKLSSSQKKQQARLDEMANSIIFSISEFGHSVDKYETKVIKESLHQLYSGMKTYYKNRNNDINVEDDKVFQVEAYLVMNKIDENIYSLFAYDHAIDETVYRVFHDRFFGGSSESENVKNILKSFQEIFEMEENLEYVDALIEVRENDLLTIMRGYAGHYQRIIFAVVWYALFFQLIALAFIYFKRLFVIALLITIFPLVMIFYCIDKMADGTAQTLSMWFKELLANIFIQSVHCVIYTVLIQMGLDIYSNNPNDWILFLAAMLLLIPAESILKTIFDLKGSTLGQLGGMGMKLAMGVGAAVTLLKSWRGKKDEGFVKAQNARFDKLQRKQSNADMKASTRKYKRIQAGKSADSNGFREKAYHAATNIRKAEVKVAPKIVNATRVAKNVAGIAGGLMYGVASGGNVENMLTGISVGKAITGKTKNAKGDKAKIKDNLAAAYNRKNKKP